MLVKCWNKEITQRRGSGLAKPKTGLHGLGFGLGHVILTTGCAEGVGCGVDVADVMLGGGVCMRRQGWVVWCPNPKTEQCERGFCWGCAN